MRRQYQAKGFLDKSEDVLSNACKNKTTKKFQSSGNNGCVTGLVVGWCYTSIGNLSPFSVSIIDFLEYLSSEFQNKKCYSALIIVLYGQKLFTKLMVFQLGNIQLYLDFKKMYTIWIKLNQSTVQFGMFQLSWSIINHYQAMTEGFNIQTCYISSSGFSG